MSSNFTVEQVTKNVQDYMYGILCVNSGGVETEMHFNNAGVEDLDGCRAAFFEQVNSGTKIKFDENEIASIAENVESNDPVYNITLKDETKINIIYINKEIKKYDVTNMDGDILPDELAGMIEKAKDIVIGIYSANMCIDNTLYEDVRLIESEEMGEWDLEFSNINVKLYEDSCNQIYRITDGQFFREYIIRPFGMPFTEIYVKLLL